MTHDLQLNHGKKLFFASDCHLGEPDYQTSREREEKVVAWLDTFKDESAGFFLLGDIFDFWFEYNHVIPKGYVRFLGKLAEITDQGIPVFFFTGNHDMWLFDYFSTELNISVFREPQSFEVNDKLLQVGHGDGLGPGQGSYKMLKTMFSSPMCQWMFKWLHPNVGFAIANLWSRKSRRHNGVAQPFISADDEKIFQHCEDTEAEQHHDFYVFGHRHLALELPISSNSIYYNVGEWIQGFTYGVYDGTRFKLDTFD
jgi:UDP-2,3-diacylglucosamine hydrolase